MFISNNRASFHLWWKKNLVKHQRLSKYYENDCCCKLSFSGFLHSTVTWGINVNQWYIIIITIHIMLLFAFSCAELWVIFISYSHNLLIKILICNEKQTNWTYKQYYVKTSRYFYQKLNHLFFNCRKNLRSLSFGDGIYIVATSAFDIFHKYIIQKEKYIYLKEFHIWHRHLTVQIKYSYTLPSLRVGYFTENKCLKFP